MAYKSPYLCQFLHGGIIVGYAFGEIFAPLDGYGPSSFDEPARQSLSAKLCRFSCKMQHITSLDRRSLRDEKSSWRRCDTRTCDGIEVTRILKNNNRGQNEV